MSDQMSDPKLYFTGINPKGEYLTPPASLEEIVKRLKEKGWQAPPDWVLEWTHEHTADEDDRLRKPVFETDRPWDLTETGWGVVFAPDLDPRVRTELEDLVEHRRQQATADGKSHYFADYTYRGESTVDFVKGHGGKPGMPADPDNVPYYLLLVGSPESLPYKFQAELDVNHAVGRIYFDDLADYGNYARSVVKAEDLQRPRSEEVVFFGTKHENDPATQRTADDLVHQLAESVLEPGAPWKAREVLGEEARKKQLRAFLGGAETPAFLFAACHGVGFDADDERQEECQGALVCQDWPGPDDEEGVGDDQWFAASDVPEEEASLHGLVAFLYACYGVGTPQRDNFNQTVLAKPKQIAPGPLVSRLPQRLLCPKNLPRDTGGALAVIGHVDRAWTASFEGSPRNEGIGAILYGVRRLLQGHTVGWAMEYLNQSYASLAAMLGNMDEAWHNREKVDRDQYLSLWLLRNDARNFVVFGDPAVRLPGVGEPKERMRIGAKPACLQRQKVRVRGRNSSGP